MYSNPAWEWFHTRGMCARSSDYEIFSFYSSLYDMLDLKMCVWALWVLIYTLPLFTFIEVCSITLATLNAYIAGLLVPIPAPCLYSVYISVRVFSADEFILFPAVLMLLLRAVFTPLKKELSTLFFWTNFICVLICTGCVSLITGRSNLQMVAFTGILAVLCYIYATWTPFCMRIAEGVVLLILLCIYTDRSASFEYAFQLCLMGAITGILVPLVFLTMDRTTVRSAFPILFKPIAIIKKARKKDAAVLPIALSFSFLYSAYQITLFVPLLLGIYYYKKYTQS
ncbi:Hypothetical protein DHA2_153914 [Giardia duodenalis]|uniref:Uncharacterized protein n=1 Tax=Giardia intestinalis TaxID=5741 RepID=V6T9U0_GIAIN|nr:Hypothetical protein DHA2_153914 [Giardia intestinalis]